MKLLIVVDMQNDFIDGSLANKDAEAIVPGICNLIKHFDGKIAYTMDTHSLNYLSTLEGEHLPVKHCIKGTPGWNLNKDIQKALEESNIEKYGYPTMVEKPTFGYPGWLYTGLFDQYGDEEIDEIVLVGTCTDICVVSNALILKALFPDVEVTVLKDLCAGLSKEKHEAALETMRSCQIHVN